MSGPRPSISGALNASLTGVRARRAGGTVTGTAAAAGLATSDRTQAPDVRMQ
jgi:hypothetical protein